MQDQLVQDMENMRVPMLPHGEAPETRGTVQGEEHACLGTENVDGGGKLRTQQRHGCSLGSPTIPFRNTGCCYVVAAR